MTNEACAVGLSELQFSLKQIEEETIMVVQHNLSAMNTSRQMNGVASSLSKSTEKLSSGYKINRAGDDAAGLQFPRKDEKPDQRTLTKLLQMHRMVSHLFR